jgi:hypothetical protein
MSNLSYSEQRQAAYFKCARELRATACQILDEVTTETELKGGTAPWALRLAVKVAKEAGAVEETAYGLITVEPRRDVANYKSRAAYSRSVDEFQARLGKALGLGSIETNELTREWVKPPNLPGFTS